MGCMIGGSFGFTPARGKGDFPPEEGDACVFVSSGRAALELLLLNLPQRPRRVLVPRFACDTLLQPMEHLGLPVIRYGCDDALCPILPTDRGEEDVLVLINYFGLSEPTELEQMAAAHPGPVLTDATTAFYAPLPAHADGIFYSFRKFFPVPDGGAARARYPLTLRPCERDDCPARLRALHRISELGIIAAQEDVAAAEASFSAPPRLLAASTRALLQGIRAQAAARQRMENYRILHRSLAELNRLSLPETPPSAPMCYPLFSGIPDLRDSLIDAGIALPFYWPEVIAAYGAQETENKLARTLLPLPLDQRYGAAEMQRIVRLILSGGR